MSCYKKLHPAVCHSMYTETINANICNPPVTFIGLYPLIDLSKISPIEAVVQRCSVKKVLLKISLNSQEKTPLPEFSF